jgi:hypothetical protein
MGDIQGIPLRGAWTGNRGILHSDHTIIRFHASDLWITCSLAFRGRWHQQWQPHHYTFLFFHDEAVSFAAGEDARTRTTIAFGHINLARLDLDAGEAPSAAAHLNEAFLSMDPVADRWVLVDGLEAVARLAHHAELPARVVIDHHRKLDIVFKILLDGFNEGNLARQSHVHNVGLLGRTQANPVANSHFDAEDAYAFRRRLRLFERVPFTDHVRHLEYL